MTDQGFSMGNAGRKVENRINTSLQDQRVIQDNKIIQNWLTDTSCSFFELAGGQKGSVYRYQISPRSSDESYCPR